MGVDSGRNISGQGGIFVPRGQYQPQVAGRQGALLYLAFGATHGPIQVPREYVEKYLNAYTKGWDAIRAERFARQKQLGIVPADTQLPPRNPGDRAWSDLSADERTVYARHMAVYAGFVEHTDAQIGRLVRYLQGSGQFDNTLIVLLSEACCHCVRPDSRRANRPTILLPPDQYRNTWLRV
jgi:arylsulfatase A-like enzyme